MTPAQLEQRRNAGLALKAKRDPDYYQRIGKMGGRPTFDKSLERARQRASAKRGRGRS